MLKVKLTTVADAAAVAEPIAALRAGSLAVRPFQCIFEKSNRDRHEVAGNLDMISSSANHLSRGAVALLEPKILFGCAQSQHHLFLATSYPDK